MSDATLITSREFWGLLALGKTAFNDLRQRGLVGPMPIKLGRSVRWRKAEVDQWVNEGCPPRCRWTWALGKGGNR